MDAFLRLLRYATPHRAVIAGAALAMVVYGAASAALAYLIKPIIDDVLTRRSDLAMVTAAILVVYPLVRFGKKVRTVTRWSQEANERMSHVAAEAFTGHRIVKAFGAERREAAKFDRASSSLFKTNLKVTRVLALLPPLMEFLGGVAIAGALWYGSREIANNRLTAGEFTSFVAALLLMYGPVKKLSRVNANLQQAAAASERIFELLDKHTEVIELPDARPLPPFRDEIEFRDVVFQYEDGHGRNTL